MQNTNESSDRNGWTTPLPERLPRQTYWPAMLAFGMTVTLLGPVTSMAISVAGGVFAAVALAGWIAEIRA